MSVSLKKGQKISLSKESSGGLSSVVVGLGWDAAPAEPPKGLLGKLFGGSSSTPIDCDASAIMLQGGKLLDNKDIVYFGNLRHKSDTVWHMGDNLTGEGDGDDEQIVINLAAVLSNYDKIVIVVNIYNAQKRGQDFGMIQNAFVRIVDQKNNKELCKFNLTETYPNCYAMIFGEVYRHEGEWKFNAVGQGTRDDGISELASRYL